MTQIFSTSTAYDAALHGAALAEEHSAGRILMRGRDRAALLHRLSTNDIQRLRPGQGARTVLTTPIGRIIDLLTIHALDDALLVATGPGQGGAVWAHLKKNIFFQDQVTLEAAGRAYGQLALYGLQAAALLEQLGGADMSALPLFHQRTLTLAGAPVIVASRQPIGGPSLTLYVPSAQLDDVGAALETAGAATLDPAALDVLRVEAGLPATGRELSTAQVIGIASFVLLVSWTLFALFTWLGLLGTPFTGNSFKRFGADFGTGFAAWWISGFLGVAVPTWVIALVLTPLLYRAVRPALIRQGMIAARA